ncbi:MAG: GNAT family N-acetyltransferase [Deltaproteobacteria bacterium]|nr:GNAT family N-acetyltransferase [Deltaproteobacteria bacterium]
MVLHPVQLRPARVSDASRIAQLSRRLIEQGLPWRWRPQRVARLLAAPDHLSVVAHTTDGEIVGFAIMQIIEQRADLLLCAVSPAQRRRGIGRRLLGWLERCAITAGTSSIRLEVRKKNREAQSFYRHMGYSVVDRTPYYYSGREMALKMIRRLPGPNNDQWSAARRLIAQAIDEAVNKPPR